MKMTSKFLISFVLLGYGLGLQANQLNQSSKPSCAPDLLSKLSRTQIARDLSRDPVALISAEEALVKRGAIFKRWDPELETMIYSTMAEPQKDGSVPLVSKEAKAVVIFFHGSGTAKASGNNFKENQNILRPFGIAGISFDLPFHGENKGSEKLKKIEPFMEWVHQLVTKVKNEAQKNGKPIPIYMMGHSFGPGIIQEYVERYPKDLADFLLMSPSGDFHPALKYTYEKITTPGQKFLEGEPIVENAAGGEWAGEIEGQFTWSKRKPFDRIPGKMLIGEQDEWWPGNKDLARKVGMAQPFEFSQPLEAFQKKYPQMAITTIPGVGHMLFEAKAANGRNLVRETLLDMIGVPEKDRNPAGVPILPAERIALLYNESPIFRNWLGARYDHTFRDPDRAARVLQDWENSKWASWRKILDRLPEEHPEFFKARGYSWGLALQTAKLKEPSLDSATKVLQQELVAFLQRDSKQKAEILSRPDPEKPKPLKVASALLEKGWAPTKSGATGPLLKNKFLEEIRKREAVDVTETPLRPGLVKLSYQIKGQTYESVVLDYIEAELNQKLNELYLRAHEINNFACPGETVELVDGGLKWKFSSKDRANVTKVEVSQD
jgi:pimeloyl-ACP methyl ester carboxylesterase